MSRVGHPDSARVYLTAHRFETKRTVLVAYTDALLQTRNPHANATGRFNVHNDEHILLDEGYSLDEDLLSDLDEPLGNQIIWDDVHAMDMTSVLESEDVPVGTECDDIFEHDEFQLSMASNELLNSDIGPDDLRSEWSFSDEINCFDCDDCVPDLGFASPNSVVDSVGGDSMPDSTTCDFDFLV